MELFVTLMTLEDWFYRDSRMKQNQCWLLYTNGNCKEIYSWCSSTSPQPWLPYSFQKHSCPNLFWPSWEVKKLFPNHSNQFSISFSKKSLKGKINYDFKLFFSRYYDFKLFLSLCLDSEEFFMSFKCLNLINLHRT